MKRRRNEIGPNFNPNCLWKFKSKSSSVSSEYNVPTTLSIKEIKSSDKQQPGNCTMNPRYLRNDDLESKCVGCTDPRYEAIQTSNTSVINADDCHHVSQERSEDKDHRFLKIFDFCQIFTEPGNSNAVTIIKDSVSEESLSHTEGVESEAQASNRYKYCREVIKPYLKNSKECLNNEEDIVNGAISTAQEDFPDYQPCNEVYFGALDDVNGKFYKGNPGNKNPCNSTDNQSENVIHRKSSCLSKNSVSSNGSISRGKAFEVQAKDLSCAKSKEPCCDPKKPRPKEVIIRSCKPKKKKEKKICPSPLDERGNKSCVCKPNEPAIAVRPEGYKPRYYLSDKCSLCRPCSTKCTENQKSQESAKSCKADDNLPERMKKTVGDILGKLCNGAKDTVALFKKDRNRCAVHEPVTKDKPCACDKDEIKPKQVSDTRSCESVFSYKVKAYDTIEKEDENLSVVEQICSKIESLDSSLSCLREAKNRSLEKLEDMYKNSSFFKDDSSLYNEPTREESDKLFLRTAPNNMFTLIKSKIYAFFSDMRDANNLRDSSDRQSDEESDKSLPPTEVSRYRSESDDNLIRRCIE